MVLKVFCTSESAFLRQLFVSYIRPTLEYAALVWSPSSVVSRDMLERVQRRFTKRMRGYENLLYGDRLTSLNLDSLVRRRLYHDMLLVFKASHGFASSKPESFSLKLSRAPTAEAATKAIKQCYCGQLLLQGTKRVGLSN